MLCKVLMLGRGTPCRFEQKVNNSFYQLVIGSGIMFPVYLFDHFGFICRQVFIVTQKAGHVMLYRKAHKTYLDVVRVGINCRAKRSFGVFKVLNFVIWVPGMLGL